MLVDRPGEVGDEAAALATLARTALVGLALGDLGLVRRDLGLLDGEVAVGGDGRLVLGDGRGEATGVGTRGGHALLELGLQRRYLAPARRARDAAAMNAREAVPRLRKAHAPNAIARTMGGEHRADAAAVRERSGDDGVAVKARQHGAARTLR